MDLQNDRENGINSFPARFGEQHTLRTSIQLTLVWFLVLPSLIQLMRFSFLAAAAPHVCDKYRCDSIATALGRFPEDIFLHQRCHWMGIAWRVDYCMNSVDPFDLSKALDGAAKAHLDPSVSRFIRSEYEPAGDQESAIEKTVNQLRKFPIEMCHVGRHGFRENIRHGQCHPITEYPHTHPISQQDLVQTTLARDVACSQKCSGIFCITLRLLSNLRHISRKEIFTSKRNCR